MVDAISETHTEGSTEPRKYTRRTRQGDKDAWTHSGEFPRINAEVLYVSLALMKTQCDGCDCLQGLPRKRHPRYVRVRFSPHAYKI